MNNNNKLPTNDKVTQKQKTDIYYISDEVINVGWSDSFDKQIRIRLLRMMLAKRILNKQTYDKVRQIIAREEVTR